LLEFHLSKHEAFLTDSPNYTSDQKLPQFGLISQISIATFLLVTEISIKLFFSCKSKQKGKLEIKNTIGFKNLTVIYSLGLFLSAFLQGMIMMSEYNVMHYNVSVVINMMLLSFILTDQEARKYFSLKLQSRILEITLYIEHVRKPFFTLTLDPPSVRSVPLNANHNADDIYVINLEE
jgi:hypothetical protein